ncbi:MAG: trimeric intracellular cation channel family protein [Chloroflexia bacterium]|nr:trimeric intracellular cation channel family protein [Chloroflexia bacterium]
MFDPWSLFDFVDLFGVFVGAFSGALVARRHGYDITGLWGLALVTGLGGGIIRDLCLQVGPPLALTEPAYLPVVAVATLAGAFYGHRVDQTRVPIVVADSVALIGFAVAGSLRTINYDFGAWSTVLLGVITAVGGGVIRDVLTGDTSMIFRRGELYAFAALGASLAMVLAEAGGATRGVMVLLGFAVGLALRFGSLRFGWTSWTPR